MKGIEVNVETGEQKVVKLTDEEIKRQKLAYEASLKAHTWNDIRTKRDQLIRESDWTMVQDATVNQAAWAQYRQILRDLPQTYASVTPDKVVWPEPPLAAGPNTVTEIE
jgi:hypothetical protein